MIFVVVKLRGCVADFQRINKIIP